MFVTLTPNESGSATVKYFAGDIDVNSFSALGSVEINQRSINDPYACVRYFEKLRILFFENLMGFDIKKSRP